MENGRETSELLSVGNSAEGSQHLKASAHVS